MDTVIREKYCFIGSRAEDSAKYYDTVISHGYSGDMDYLAWEAAHKFGTRMTADGLASFRNGIAIGSNALTAVEFLDSEYSKAYDLCEENNRRKRMQDLMKIAYATAQNKYSVEIILL